MNEDSYRANNFDHWQASAQGWGKARGVFERIVEPVTKKLIDQLDLNPGDTVLELAAGPGETGFRALDEVGPNGKLISSDFSPAMVEVAKGRAKQLNLTNVKFSQYDLEWVDLPVASVDAILCRFGYQFALNPVTALAEARRVLKPVSGRVAFAVWAPAEFNYWAVVGSEQLESMDLLPADDWSKNKNAPGIFALSSGDELEEVTHAAGFVDISITEVPLLFAYESFDDWFAHWQNASHRAALVLSRLNSDQREHLVTGLKTRLVSYTGKTGKIEIPGVSLVVSASA